MKNQLTEAIESLEKNASYWRNESYSSDEAQASYARNELHCNECDLRMLRAALEIVTRLA